MSSEHVPWNWILVINIHDRNNIYLVIERSDSGIGISANPITSIEDCGRFYTVTEGGTKHYLFKHRGGLSRDWPILEDNGYASYDIEDCIC